VASDGGQDRHDEKGRCGGCEDLKAGVTHGHEGGDDEGLVADFACGDGGEGTHE